MEPIWEFFENMNELVYVADVDTYEFIYMNKRRFRFAGLPLWNRPKGRSATRCCRMDPRRVRFAITGNLSRDSLRSGNISIPFTTGISW